MTTDQTGDRRADDGRSAPSSSRARAVAEPQTLWPQMPRPVFIARVIIGTAGRRPCAPFYFDPVYNRLLSQAIYLAIAAMGLNLLTGFNGQVSIGHGFFYGVGAFTSAILMVDHGWTFEATIPVALVLDGIVGLLGLPALRVRGLPGARHPGPGRPVPAAGHQVRRGTGGGPGAPGRDFASLIEASTTTSGPTSSAWPSWSCCSCWPGTWCRAGSAGR